jgi:F0F1-type ATP synthase assembly protein I
MGIGWFLAVSVVVGTLGGVYTDRWLGTTPWLTLLGIALGMGAGFVGVFRTLQAAGRVRQPGHGGSAAQRDERDHEDP